LSIPGPGKYNPKMMISPNGDYFVSNLKSSFASRFGKGRRYDLIASLRKFVTPGPGSYHAPSEFGGSPKLASSQHRRPPRRPHPASLSFSLPPIKRSNPSPTQHK
jgi:hypothetical protein